MSLLVFAAIVAVVMTQFSPLDWSGADAQNVSAIGEQGSTIVPDGAAENVQVTTTTVGLTTVVPGPTTVDPTPFASGFAPVSPEGTLQGEVSGTPGDPPISSDLQIDAIVRPTNSWINIFGETALLGGKPVQIGDVISAFDSDGTLSGQFVITTERKYGLMAVYIDDPTTELDEGISPGGQISFKINGFPAFALEADNPQWIANGMLLQLDLTADISSVAAVE